MKKFLLLSPLVAMLGLMACESDNDQQIQIRFQVPVINIVSNLQSGETSATKGTYLMNLIYTGADGTGEISSNDLVLNASNMTLTTQESPFGGNSWLGSAYFKNVKGTVSGNNSYDITNSLFYSTPFYFYTPAHAGNYTYTPIYINTAMGAISQPVLIANYTLGNDYQVRTFPGDAFFAGKTQTQYDANGNTMTNTAEDIVYRVFFESDLSKANMVIYNARFSGNPNEPLKEAIIIKGLNVEYSTSGITISGSNLIPDVVEGLATTPYPDYIFNDIVFRTTDKNLTLCTISYQVAGRYYGSFSGSYINDNYFN